MDRLGLLQNAVPEVPAQAARRDEVDPAAEQQGKLVLHGDEGQAGGVARLKFHQHVDVALWPKVGPMHGTEQRQPAIVVTPAIVGDEVLGGLHAGWIIARRLPPDADSVSLRHYTGSLMAKSSNRG
jgi:hypothetical protein